LHAPLAARLPTSVAAVYSRKPGLYSAWKGRGESEHYNDVLKKRKPIIAVRSRNKKLILLFLSKLQPGKKRRRSLFPERHHKRTKRSSAVSKEKGERKDPRRTLRLTAPPKTRRGGGVAERRRGVCITQKAKKENRFLR